MRGPLNSLFGGSPRRRILVALGGLTFVVGISLLGYGLLTSTESGDERAPGPALRVFDSATPSPVPAPTVAEPTPVLVPPLGDVPYTMIIDKIGVNNPVQPFGLDANQVPEVPTGTDAAKIVAWYNFSAKPGTGSNAVFAGHVTWFGAAVFYNLTSLANGDVIRLKGQDGTELVYTVFDVYSVNPRDPNSLKVMGPADHDVLTIITCDGSFTYTGDHTFGGEYDTRLVIQANITSVVHPNAAAAVGG
jgi:LPXTG-site transpeptidase (sortase) family protein